ncbi:MAG: serine hydrolase domain-containing protein [Planctomycetota bacterium]|jgi:CubicO group peptidase (beta-lactamase class C family)
MRRIVVGCVLFLASRLFAGEDLGESLDDYLSRCEAFGFSGSALVARGGKVLLERGYGLADRDSGRSNAAHTLFEIASATKPFTAAAILKLEAEGRLSTGDPITKHLPGVPKALRDITIYHLLTHTSGMPRTAAGGGGHDLEAAVAAYLRTRRVRKPGERFEYWNGGYALLAGIVETVTGGTYMAYCRKHLFEPAGMTRTGFTGDAHLDEATMAVGYDGERALRKAAGHPYGSYGWQYRGMGGIVTSVADLYKWDRALYTDKVLGKAAREKAFRPHLPPYACGWYVVETDQGTRKIAHGGDVRGFHTQLARFPDEDAVVIVLGNVEQVPMWSISGNLERLLFGKTPTFPMPPETVELKAEDLHALAGTYELSDGSRFVVRQDGSGILIGAEGQAADDLLHARVRLARRADRFETQGQLAVRIVENLARGEVEMLRGLILDRIPRGWPDTLKRAIWPRHLERWGALRSARALGASLAGRERVQVVLALEHENGSARCRVVFEGGKLSIFDLSGPEFVASARCLPASKERFVRFAWVGPAPGPVIFEREDEGNVVALAIKLVIGGTVRCRKLVENREK